jgi:phosphoglycerate kinase
VGKSLCEHDLAGTAREITARAKASGCELILPVDVVTATEFKAGAASQTVGVDEVSGDAMILDAGPESVARIKDVFDKAKTLVWNGPLGAFEIPPFNAATDAAAMHAADLSAAGKLLTVAGGGDTVAALNKSGAAENFNYISTAGGAFLEWLEGKTLPGVAALETSEKGH